MATRLTHVGGQWRLAREGEAPIDANSLETLLRHARRLRVDRIEVRVPAAGAIALVWSPGLNGWKLDI